MLRRLYRAKTIKVLVCFAHWLLPVNSHAGLDPQDPDLFGCPDYYQVLTFTPNEQRLLGARKHIIRPQHVDRAITKDGRAAQWWSAQLNLPIAEIVEIEPIPGQTPLPIVGVLVTYPKSQKISPLRIDFALPTVNGKTQIPAPANIPDCTLHFIVKKSEDFFSLSITKQGLPPAGYRYVIRNNKDFRNRGFAGGHTKESWKTTLQTYSDLIEVNSEETITFQLPNYGVTLEATSVSYSIGETVPRQEVKVPKTLLEVKSGNLKMSQFERALAEQIDTLQKEKDGLIHLSIPIKNSSNGKSELKVVVAFSEGRINSWWISKENFK